MQLTCDGAEKCSKIRVKKKAEKESAKKSEKIKKLLKEIKSSARELSEILLRGAWESERVALHECVVCLWRLCRCQRRCRRLSAAEGCRRFVNVRFVQSSTAFVTGNVVSFVRRRKKSRISEDFWILLPHKAVQLLLLSRGAGVCACVPLSLTVCVRRVCVCAEESPHPLHTKNS